MKRLILMFMLPAILCSQGFFARVDGNCTLYQYFVSTGAVRCDMSGECRDGSSYFVSVWAGAWATNCLPYADLYAETRFLNGLQRVTANSRWDYGSWSGVVNVWADCDGGYSIVGGSSFECAANL